MFKYWLKSIRTPIIGQYGALTPIDQCGNAQKVMYWRIMTAISEQFDTYGNQDNPGDAPRVTLYLHISLDIIGMPVHVMVFKLHDCN